MDQRHHTINYIEFPLTDRAATMAFYRSVFGWQFTEWGDAYISFAAAGIEGGFNGEAAVARPGALVILYSADLPATARAIADAGGVIVRPAYAFPGGRRFHFHDPNGNELAVWSEA